MKLKIMITGKNRRIADDICRHLETDRDYLVLRCSATQDDLFKHVPVEMPRVVVICLGNETKESVKVFNALNECAKLSRITIIVVANSEDRELFCKYTTLDRLFFMSRPVSLYVLYDKLAEIEKKYEEEGEDYPILSEFINPAGDGQIRRRHILVVDDNAQQLMQIKEHLREFYQVTLVNRGELAFRVLDKSIVDLILLDYLMPGMDGPEVYKRIRELPEYANIPVVFLTGVSEKETVIKTLVELLPQGYIVKPARKSELVAKIIDVLDAADNAAAQEDEL